MLGVISYRGESECGDEFSIFDLVKSFGEINRHGRRGSGGKGSLKPWAILCARGRRADTVEWLGRKRCWSDERGSE